MSGFLIQPLALLEEFEEPLAGIVCLQERPIFVVPGALQLRIDRGLKIHGCAAFVEMATVFGRQDCAAAGCQYDSVPLGQLIDDGSLPTPKASLALDVEDEWNIGAGALFDDSVAIEQWQPEGVCQSFADCGLAGPHWANQKDLLVHRLVQLKRKGQIGPVHRMPASRALVQAKRLF